MSAYAISLRDKMLDKAEYGLYIQLAPSFAKYNSKIIVFNGEIETLGGYLAQSFMVIKYPNMAIARNWYNSPEYAPYPHIEAPIGGVVLVEGIA